MIISLYTSERYIDSKKEAIEEVVKKLGITMDVPLQTSFRPPVPLQTFGFEEMFKRSRLCATEALDHGNNPDVGIGIENSLSVIYSEAKWYYVIGVCVQTKDGRHAESFTPGIMVPEWMTKEIQENNLKMDSLTQSLAGESDPVFYFSGGMLTRKDLLVPTLFLAFSNLNLENHSSTK